MAVSIRQASERDAGSLAALRRAWVEEQAGGPVDDPAFEDEFSSWFRREHGQRVTWLAEEAGDAVGMLNMLVFTRMPRPGRAVSRWGYLANFFVLSSHRGRGLGERLLSSCVDHADAHGFVRVVLSPSERSVPLYRRHGFAAADELMVRRPGATGPSAAS